MEKFTFTDLDSLAKAFRRWRESDVKQSLVHRGTKAAYHEGRASVYRELAEMIEKKLLVQDVGEMTLTTTNAMAKKERKPIPKLDQLILDKLWCQTSFSENGIAACLWSGMKYDDFDGHYCYPQGSALGDTLIQLGDTYEGSNEDCRFIEALLQLWKEGRLTVS